MYGIGSSIAYKSYTFASSTNEKDTIFDYYVFSVLLITSLCNIISCSSRFIYSHKKRKILRALAFIGQYLFINLPLIFKLATRYLLPNSYLSMKFLFIDIDRNETSLIKEYQNDYFEQFVNNMTKNLTIVEFKTQSDVYYMLHFITAVLAVCFYVFHVPESLLPGKFDLIGQSHQIFHLFSFLCSWSQYVALKIDMKEILDSKSSNGNSLKINNSKIPFIDINLGYGSLIILSISVNLIILLYYYLKLVYYNPWQKIASNNKTKTN
jgi:hypothetical protein